MIKNYFLLLAFTISGATSFAISPYYNFGGINTTTSRALEEVSNTLISNEFEILGTYHPEGNPKLNVIAFTSDELKKITFSVNNRGALASVLKVSIIENEGTPNLILLNPEYIFWAYLGDQMEKTSISMPLNKINDHLIIALKSITKSFDKTGEDIDKYDLKTYHYMIGMERFSDPVTLNTFVSFDEGVRTIESNLTKGTGDFKLVYKSTVPGKETAVYGIGLLNKEIGEPHFLPIIGEEHAAELPYEIILERNKVTMLHGRYRIALHSPELTMMTFSKIMSTPGDIENQLKVLTEK